MKLSFKKLKPFAKLPVAKGNTMEVYACLEQEFTLSSGEAAIVPIGLSFKKIEGYEAEIRPTRELSEHAIAVLDPTGHVNYDDVVVLLINHSRSNFTVENGMCVAEMAISIAPVRCFIEENSEYQKYSGNETLEVEKTDGHVPYTKIMDKKSPTRDEIMDKLTLVSMGKK